MGVQTTFSTDKLVKQVSMEGMHIGFRVRGRVRVRGSDWVHVAHARHVPV